MRSSRPTNGLDAASVWFDLPDVSFAASNATLGDFNRDGKDDLAVAYSPTDGSTHIDVIRRARTHVKRFPLWTRSKPTATLSHLAVIRKAKPARCSDSVWCRI